MPTFSYTPKTTKGAGGAHHDFNPASASAEEGDSDTITYKALGTFGDLTYVWVEDADAMLPQSGEINLTEVADADLPEGLLSAQVAELKAGIKEQISGYINSNISDICFTSSLGFEADGDLRSRINLLTLEDQLGSEDTAEFVDRNNETHTVTRENVETLLEELNANITNLYTQKWEITQQLTACTNLDDMFEVDTTLKMKDFSS